MGGVSCACECPYYKINTLGGQRPKISHKPEVLLEF